MATKIKVPGVLTVGTGDHYGTTDGLKDIELGKMQNEINRKAVALIEFEGTATNVKMTTKISTGATREVKTIPAATKTAAGVMTPDQVKAVDVDEMTKSSYDALDEAGKKAAREAHTWFVVTE